MFSNQSPVVQRVDNMNQWINLYPLDSTIGFPDTCYSLTRWLVIYLVDSPIQHLNNWDQN